MRSVDPILLADLIVVLHLAYVLFVILGLLAVVVGKFRGWDWIHHRGFRWSHLVCTLIVPLEALNGILCPLTRWEGELRREGGQWSDEDLGFVARIVRKVLFYDAPPWLLTVCYVVFGLTVLGVFIGIPPRRKSRAQPPDPSRAQ